MFLYSTHIKFSCHVQNQQPDQNTPVKVANRHLSSAQHGASPRDACNVLPSFAFSFWKTSEKSHVSATEVASVTSTQLNSINNVAGLLTAHLPAAESIRASCLCGCSVRFKWYNIPNETSMTSSRRIFIIDRTGRLCHWRLFIFLRQGW